MLCVDTLLVVAGVFSSVQGHNLEALGLAAFIAGTILGQRSGAASSLEAAIPIAGLGALTSGALFSPILLSFWLEQVGLPNSFYTPEYRASVQSPLSEEIVSMVGLMTLDFVTVLVVYGVAFSKNSQSIRVEKSRDEGSSS